MAKPRSQRIHIDSAITCFGQDIGFHFFEHIDGRSCVVKVQQGGEHQDQRSDNDDKRNE
ncbi:hypothetical protein D3C86_1966490 [compost metagenome]